MKKIVTIATFLLFFASFSYSQDSELGPGLRLGFQASPTFSWMSGETATINGNGTNLGIKLQILGEMYFQKNYAFTIGFGFAFGQGGVLQFDETGEYWANSISDEDYPLLANGDRGFDAGEKKDDKVVNLKYDIQYIEVPIGLKLRTREFGYFRYFVEPQFIVAIRSKARGTVKNDPEQRFEKIDIKNDVNPINVSWGIGGGTEYGISENTAIVVGAYFNNGLLDVTRNKGDGDDKTKATMSAITLRLAVIF